MPKDKKNKAKRHHPLERQVTEHDDPTVHHKPWREAARRKRDDAEDFQLREDADVEGGASFVRAATTQKIMEMAREQQREVEGEMRERSVEQTAARAQTVAAQAAASHRGKADDDSDDSDDDHHTANDIYAAMGDDDDEEEEEELIEIDGDYVSGLGDMDDAEERVFANWMNPFEKRNLADIIMAKIKEKEDEPMMADGNDDGGGGGGGGNAAAPAQQQQQQRNEIPARVCEVYEKVGKILKRYTAGKIPKAFKIIPSLSNWEEIMWLTEPFDWSPCAMKYATRVFASNLNPRMAQRFYNTVLLPSVVEVKMPIYILHSTPKNIHSNHNFSTRID
jgi:essential nuclear protein 1